MIRHARSALRAFCSAWTPPENALATTLSDHPEEAPDFLREWTGLGAVRKDGLRFYRLYEVDHAKLPP